MEKEVAEKIIKDLEQALELICKVDNLYPGNKEIHSLYDIIFETYKYFNLKK